MRNHKRMLDDLRDRGYAVRVTHERAFELLCQCRTVHRFLAKVVPQGGTADPDEVPACWQGAPIKLLARGGQTHVNIFDTYVRPPQLVGEGSAHCHPYDPFVRRVGFDIALGRAQLQAELDDLLTFDQHRR